jgi:hypothetical protein
VFPSIDQFSRVVLTFAGSPTVDDVEVTGGAVTINLPVGGPWAVTADAYRDDILAAHSTAAHTLEWTGTGQVAVTGGTRFVLEPAGTGDGTLSGAVKPPEKMTLGEGSRITITNLFDQSVVFEQDLSGGEGEDMGGDMPLSAGRYSVEVVLVDDATGDTAVYHRTVAILSGLMTKIGFEPDDVDFLSEEARAAMTGVENLEFGPTEDNTSKVDMNLDDLENGNIAVVIPAGTTTIYFTVDNPDELILTPVNAVWVADAEGSYSSATLSVFEVDTTELANLNKSELIVTITAVEEGKEGIPITLTVTPDLEFGLYIDTAGELAKVEDPSLTDLQTVLAYLQSSAANNTSYVIQLTGDSDLTGYESRTPVSNITVTLQGSPGGNSVTSRGEYFSASGLFYINAGTTFVLGKNITLDGKNAPLDSTSSASTSKAMVFVGQNSTFRMQAGSKITGCIGGSGTVWVYTNGTFIMEGGEISGNANRRNSGAVVVQTASFTLLDGKISDNENGVTVSGQSTVVMEGGEISDNKMTASGGYDSGKGIRISNGNSSNLDRKSVV